MHFLFLFKECFPFDDLSPLLVNLKSHSQPTFPQPAKGKETRTLSSSLRLQGIAIGTTAMLCCLGMYFRVSLSLHLMSWFHLCLILVPSSLSHTFLVPQLWFFKLFQAFPIYCIFSSALCECCQPTWQWARGNQLSRGNEQAGTAVINILVYPWDFISYLLENWGLD